jgi:hypothetical protein
MSGTSGAGKRPEAYLPAATAPATGSGLIDRRGGWVLRAAQRAAQPVPPKRCVLTVSGGPDSSSQCPHLFRHLLQPEPHVHLAVHRRGGGEVLPAPGAACRCLGTACPCNVADLSRSRLPVENPRFLMRFDRAADSGAAGIGLAGGPQYESAVGHGGKVRMTAPRSARASRGGSAPAHDSPMVAERHAPPPLAYACLSAFQAASPMPVVKQRVCWNSPLFCRYTFELISTYLVEPSFARRRAG